MNKIIEEKTDSPDPVPTSNPVEEKTESQKSSLTLSNKPNKPKKRRKKRSIEISLDDK